MSQLKTVTVRNYRLSNHELYDFELSYQLFGQPLHTAPIVLVNHALTGNSEVAGPGGWWNEIIGEEKLIDLNEFTVIAFDVPGNGFGENPVLLPVNYRLLTTKIIAELFWLALDKLAVDRLFGVIGGSIGGCIGWEMAFLRPESIENLVPIAAGLKSSDWLIANVQVQEEILNYSENPIETARKHAMLLYRTPKSFELKFKNQFNKEENKYAVESWLNYHGNALKNRFSADAYRLMNHLLKTTGVELTDRDLLKFSAETTAKIFLISVDSDYMFTNEEQKQIYRLIRRNKYDVSYSEIQSVHGHDAFLIEYEQLNDLLKKIFVKKSGHPALRNLRVTVA